MRKLDAALPGITSKVEQSLENIRVTSEAVRIVATGELSGLVGDAGGLVSDTSEVVRGAKTGKDVLATTMKLGKKLKKVPIVSGVCDGFIGNRMLERYTQQAGFLLDEGASPQQVDAALQNWGMAMGPFTMSDMAGNDIGWDIRKRRYY